MDSSRPYRFLLTNEVFAQNDKYILKALYEEDKANYLMLYRENSIVEKASSKMSDVDYDEFAKNTCFMYLFS